MKGDLTVKCYLCKQSEAAFSADCLVVDYKSEVNEMQYMGQVLSKGYTMTETGGGVAVAGLCPACMKKASRHISHEASSSKWITSIAIVVGLIGFILFIYGFYQVDRYDVPLDQFLKTPASTPFVVGGAAAIVLCLILLGIDVLLAPGRVRKNAPWKLMGRAMDAELYGDRAKLVPVGEGYYANYKAFRLINDHLLDETARKIYDNNIKTGMWVKLVALAKNTGLNLREE